MKSLINNSILKITGTIAIVAFFAMGCEKNNNTEEIHLQGTKWKLMGIVDVQTESLRVLGPEPCLTDSSGCYTLYFETSDEFSGQSIINHISGKYEINNRKLIIKNTITSEANEPEEGKNYIDILFNQIQSYSIHGTAPRTLHLHYNNDKNYLKYKEIGG